MSYLLCVIDWLVYIVTSSVYIVLPPLCNWLIGIYRYLYTEEVPIYTNQYITQRRYYNVYRRGTYIYQWFNYTEEVRHCIQKRYLYIPISQWCRGGRQCIDKGCLYIPIHQLQRKEDNVCRICIYIYQSFNYTGGKTVFTEEVLIYTNQSITQRR
jgi:hypothetical protein